MFEAPWNIYTEQLFSLCHGHPLWHPKVNKKYPVEGGLSIGDVGCLIEGSFIGFFNATLAADHETHTEFGVPEGHEPLEIETDQPCEFIGSHLCSGTVHSFNLDGEPTT